MPFKNKISCVYTITNILNNKMYIGYSNDFLRRKSGHFSALKDNKHNNSHIQNIYNKYGNIFDIEILEEYPEMILPAMEHYWCNVFDVHKHGYNQKPTHPNNKVSGFKNRKHKSSTINKMKLAQLGRRRIISDQQKFNIREINKALFSKPVVILKNGKYIKEFSSIRECAKFLGTGERNVGCALQNKNGQLTAKKHTIILKEKYDQGEKNKAIYNN